MKSEKLDRSFMYRENCDICGSFKYTELYSESFSKGETYAFIESFYNGRVDKSILDKGNYTVCKCSNCGFIWQKLILNNNYMKKLYDEWISSKESFYKYQNRKISVISDLAQQIALIPILLNKKPNDISVLDFGSGWGGWCLMARAFRMNVHSAEISKRRIEWQNKEGTEVLSDIFNSKLKFHFINSEQVFEHVANPFNYLTRLVDHLRPNGILRISVPNGARFINQFRRDRWTVGNDSIAPLEHINCFTNDSLKFMANEGGLKPLNSKLFISANIKNLCFGPGNLSFFYRNIKKHFKGTAIYFMKAE